MTHGDPPTWLDDYDREHREHVRELEAEKEFARMRQQLAALRARRDR